MNSKYNGSVLCKTVCRPLKLFPVVCCYGIAWEDVDKNLKKLGQHFKVLMLCSLKSAKKLLRLVLPDEICLVSSYATCKSPIMHFIYPLKFCITSVLHFSWVLQPSPGADLGGGCRGCAPSPEMTYGFLIQLVFCRKKKLCGLLVLK